MNAFIFRRLWMGRGPIKAMPQTLAPHQQESYLWSEKKQDDPKNIPIYRAIARQTENLSNYSRFESVHKYIGETGE
jgi:hypothetical protein